MKKKVKSIEDLRVLSKKMAEESPAEEASESKEVEAKETAGRGKGMLSKMLKKAKP